MFYGGPGTDMMLSDVGNDVLNGGPGADKMYGGPGEDVLYGGDGNDVIDTTLAGGGTSSTAVKARTITGLTRATAWTAGARRRVGLLLFLRRSLTDSIERPDSPQRSSLRLVHPRQGSVRAGPVFAKTA